IIYCGQKLMRENSIESYNITGKSTLLVVRKGVHQETAQTGGSDAPGAHEVLHTLQKALQNAAYRKTVDQLLITQGAMQRMMSSVPGLASDPVALSMLQDPELLSILAHRQNIHKVLKAHPSFGKAALYIAAVVEEERTRDGSRPSRSAIYSLDQMSDEEDDRNQAAQSSSSGRAGGPAVISPDFFQQAMMQAQNAALDAQLQQLRDMGITDENIARQALTATGGDLQAALEFIFGDNSSYTS
ncbi:hypothetical protein BaRGS_00007006, partial [Batillaria attramentaria]